MPFDMASPSLDLAAERSRSMYRAGWPSPGPLSVFGKLSAFGKHTTNTYIVSVNACPAKHKYKAAQAGTHLPRDEAVDVRRELVDADNAT